MMHWFQLFVVHVLDSVLLKRDFCERQLKKTTGIEQNHSLIDINLVSVEMY